MYGWGISSLLAKIISIFLKIFGITILSSNIELCSIDYYLITSLGSVENLLDSTIFSVFIWLNYPLECEDPTSEENVTKLVNKFWDKKVSKIPKDSKIYLMLKVRYDDKDHEFKTFTNLLTVNVDNKDKVLNSFLGRIELLA